MGRPTVSVQGLGALADTVAALPVSSALVGEVVGELTSIGSCELGFRTAGTPEDLQTAQAVARRFRAAGLEGVALEPVPVDAWRFRSARVTSAAGAMPASSFGGVPATPPGGVTGRLVDAGDGTLARLDRADVRAAVVLVDWRSKAIRPGIVALELARRGAAAMIVPAGGAWFRAPGALGAFDAQWPAGGPPMVVITAADAATLRRAAPAEVTVGLQVEIARQVPGHNVVGYLPGDEPGPVVVGAHHDAWFRGAFDNTSGVAALVALATALAGSGHRPRHTICFTTRTGEEFGLLDSPFDWCTGAWRQVRETHPDWGEQSPFHLCVEASGHPRLRTVVEAPVELRAFARSAARVADARGWLPTGWRIAPPVAGTEQWPYLVAGVPGVAAYAWDASFADTEYHTQLDVRDRTIDAGLVATQARFSTLMLLAADADPDGILDHRARARQLERIAARTGHAGLAAAAGLHRAQRGRAAFSAVGRQLLALGADLEVAHPHDGADADLRALRAALAALERGDRPQALRQLRRVGSNTLSRHLGPDAMHAHLTQFTPEAMRGTWGEASHVRPGPDLGREIATLAGTARRPLTDSGLSDALASARDDALARRTEALDAMAQALAGAAG